MENKLNLNNNHTVWFLQDVEKVFQELYDHYRKIINENEYLKKENEKLKSEKYKDEELSKMKEKYDKMSEDYYRRGFPVSTEENKKINDWIDKLISEDGTSELKSGGAIGGRFTYMFIPTSLGTLGIVEDSITKQKLTFRDLL